MKKALSLALALMMLFTVCIVPMVSAEPDGSAENPYYVANPTTAPNFITIPANSTVYYQYKVAVFNGWEIGGYGLSAIIVDGVVYDQPDMWGELYASLNFNMMSPGIVGYVNSTDEEVQVMLNHNQPKGTLENPDELSNGDNYISIPANMMEYVSVYLPMVNGDYTFSTEQVEDFQIIVFADAAPDQGGTPNYVEGGSLTLTLESWMPVYVVVAPIGMTGDAIVTVTPPTAGTSDNPIWLGEDNFLDTFEWSAGDLYFDIDGSFVGNTLVIESVAGANFTATVNGVEYASEGGVLSVLLDTSDWYVPMVVTSAVDNAIAFTMEYAEGSADNPIALQLGDNTISIPAGKGGYYYSFTVEADGLLVMTPASAAGISYLSMADANYADYAYLQEGASAMMMPVTAGEIISVEIYTAMDEDTFEYLPLDTVLTVSTKELVLYNTFENGDTDGWGSKSDLSVDDVDYISGWYSAKFAATQDWANMYSYINVEKNTDYTISFKAKADHKGLVWVKFHKADWTGDVAQGDVNLTTEWTEYEITMNSGDNTSLIFMFQNAGVAADGQIIWLDDILVTKVPGQEPEVMLGDLDGNGKVNNRDLGLLLLYLNDDDLSDKTFIEAAADLDGNGKINNRDLGLLQLELNN